MRIFGIEFKVVSDEYKEVTIDGTELLFKIEGVDNGWPDRGHDITVFYDPLDPITKVRKKYFLFGEEIEKVKYKKLFSVNYDITKNGYRNNPPKDLRKHLISYKNYTRFRNLNKVLDNI